jgi:hypothetical protein
MLRVGLRTFEAVPSELFVYLHVTDGSLDYAAPPDHRAQSAYDAQRQARVVDIRAVEDDTLVSAVDDGTFRYNCPTG